MEFKPLKKGKMVFNLSIPHQIGGDGYWGCGCTSLTGMSMPKAVVSGLQMSHDYIPTAAKQTTAELIELNGGRDGIFSQFKDMLRSAYILVIMSGIGNTDDKKPAETGHNHGPWSVGGFAEWLKANGEYVISTPWLVNKLHLTHGFSLRKGWFWLPTPLSDQMSIRHIAGTEEIANKENWEKSVALPFDQWNPFYKKLAKEHLAQTLNDFELKELHG